MSRNRSWRADSQGMPCIGIVGSVSVERCITCKRCDCRRGAKVVLRLRRLLTEYPARVSIVLRNGLAVVVTNVVTNVVTIVVAILLVATSGCGSNARAPVEDRGVRAQKPQVYTSQTQASYRVQRGETLYSIAFRYGMDFRKVAAANNIAAPYTIYPGQLLVMNEAPLSSSVKVGKAPTPAASTAASKASAPASVPAASPGPVAAPQKPAVQAPTKNASDGPFVGATVSAWRWPTAGKVTRGYSGSVHKGIDIGGKRGDPVVAVAAGKVVYAGTGIVGFGELLIVKHNELYLSAYGHNDRLLVSEGQVVRAGDKIAEKGSSGTDAVKLHFEIRKEGKPIDPQRLLPRR